MTRDSNASQQSHDDRIAAAIADLKSQKKPNFMATAKKWQLERTTLAKRFKGQTRSIETYRSESSRRLSNAQEEELIGYIDKLTLRGLRPTPRIVAQSWQAQLACELRRPSQRSTLQRVFA